MENMKVKGVFEKIYYANTNERKASDTNIKLNSKARSINKEGSFIKGSGSIDNSKFICT